MNIENMKNEKTCHCRPASSRSVSIRDISVLLSAPISRIKTLRDDEGRRFGMTEVYKKAALNKNSFRAPLRSGFTLVEILVTVVIIAVLATIAVSAYQKAVVKTHITRGLALTRQIGMAMKEYYTMYGTNPTKFKDLIIALPSDLKNAYATNQSSSDIYLSDDWKIELVSEKCGNNCSYAGVTYVIHQKGTYKGAGFAYIPAYGVTAPATQGNAGKIMCIEHFCTNSKIKDQFCKQFFNGRNKKTTGCLYWYTVDL